MQELVGPEIVARYTIVDHDAEGGDHVEVGRVDGTPILLQRDYVEADVRIITGFVEPHFFAGFSGGPKAVCPGLAATETILEAHHPRRIADAASTFVTRQGNPVHDFVRAAVALAPPHLSLDVAINRDRQVTAVFAGPLEAAHDAACAFVEVVGGAACGRPLRRGRLDQRWSPARPQPLSVRQGHGGGRTDRAPGGDHRDGGGLRRRDPGRRRLRRRALPGPHAAATSSTPPSGPELDRWQAQVLGRVLQRAQVWLYSEGMTDQMTTDALLVPVHDLSTVVDDALAALGGVGSVAVLPLGPLTVATVAPPAV